MKIDDGGRVDFCNLTKVNDRTAFLAENAVNSELLKSPAKCMGLRDLPRCVIQLIHARKKVRRRPFVEAKLLLPVLLGCGGHWRYDPLPFEAVAGSARR